MFASFAFLLTGELELDSRRAGLGWFGRSTFIGVRSAVHSGVRSIERSTERLACCLGEATGEQLLSLVVLPLLLTFRIACVSMEDGELQAALVEISILETW